MSAAMIASSPCNPTSYISYLDNTKATEMQLQVTAAEALALEGRLHRDLQANPSVSKLENVACVIEYVQPSAHLAALSDSKVDRQ